MLPRAPNACRDAVIRHGTWLPLRAEAPMWQCCRKRGTTDQCYLGMFRCICKFRSTDLTFNQDETYIFQLGVIFQQPRLAFDTTRLYGGDPFQPPRSDRMRHIARMNFVDGILERSDTIDQTHSLGPCVCGGATFLLGLTSLLGTQSGRATRLPEFGKGVHTGDSWQKSLALSLWASICASQGSLTSEEFCRGSQIGRTRASLRIHIS